MARDCEEYLTEARAKGVHDLLVKLCGHCSCEFPGRVEQLFRMQADRNMVVILPPVPHDRRQSA